MRVFVDGFNKHIELPPTCVSGGEGDVYIKDKYAYKIYHDKNKALSIEKFNELKELDRPNIIKPESLIYDDNKNIIGYAMKAIPKCFSLSRLVTNDFRNQYSIDDTLVYKLIQQMRDTIEFIHNKGCLIVDGNEMNFLVDENFENVFFIDVDSYQTKSFQANAYSISTLDPLVETTKKFTSGSDWFGFGILACNLLVGIHPFKGNYKGISHTIKKGDVTSRMKLKKSIFNNKVAVNSAVRDFSIIPQHYKEWFLNIFESENRKPAPKNIFDIKVVDQLFNKNIIFNETVKSTELFKHSTKILNFIINENDMYIKDSNSFINLKDKSNYKYKEKETSMFFINKEGYLIKNTDSIEIFDLKNKTINKTNIISNNVFIVDNRIYSLYNNNLQELKYDFGKLLILNSWHVIEDTLELFTNMLVQKVSNKNILYIPFDKDNCSILNLKELENKKIVNASYKNRMIEIVYYEKGIYKRTIIKLNASMKISKIIYEEETEILSINNITLDNGIFISIFHDREIMLTSNSFEKDNINIINDKNIEILSMLYGYKNDVYLIDNNILNKITLK